MMGRNHSLCGLIAGAATAPVAASGPGQQAAWVLLCGATALLPDLDTPGSSASRSGGLATQLLTLPIGVLAGGHRQATHDLVLGTIGFTVAAWAAQLHEWSATLLVGFCLLLIAHGVLRLNLGPWGAVTNLLGCGAGAVALVHHVPSGMIPAAVALGVGVHIIGDLVTDRGVPVPVWWMWDRSRRISLGLFSTGGAVEGWIVSPLLAVLLVAAVQCSGLLPISLPAL